MDQCTQIFSPLWSTTALFQYCNLYLKGITLLKPDHPTTKGPKLFKNYLVLDVTDILWIDESCTDVQTGVFRFSFGQNKNWVASHPYFFFLLLFSTDIKNMF